MLTGCPVKSSYECKLIVDSEFSCLSMQTLGINCLYVEGASEVHPLSVAKVFAIFYAA